VRPPGPPAPFEIVLMLMTAGLMASATLANVPVVSGICTGRMGACGKAGAWARSGGRPQAL